MTKYYLWLLQVMGAANPRTIQLIRYYGDPQKVYEAISGGVNNFLKPNEAVSLKRASLEKSEEIIEYCEKSGYSIITLSSPDYPVLLKNIYNPPILLFVEGSISGLNDEVSIAVVGTRTACEYSFMVTETLCQALAKLSVVIVSGMAIGIDKVAHSAAVDVEKRTIGVLAGGIELDYPTGSKGFRKRITSLGGAVVTELLPGSRVDRFYFQNRNRIISGLSQGTLIIEAPENSGCHITAKHAINQNRDLFCIPPHNIFDPRFAGVLNYLRDGAVPVFGCADIINEYKDSFSKKYIELSKKLIDLNKINRYTEDKENLKQETPTNKTKSQEAVISKIIPQKPPTPDLQSLDKSHKAIVDLLTDGIKSMDFLIEESGLSDDDLSDILLDLEIDGIIESTAGAGYKLIEN